MYSTTYKIKESAKGNIYFALTGYNNGAKVANICFFEGSANNWTPYKKGSTAGERNLFDTFIKNVKENGFILEDIELAQHQEPVHDFKEFKVAVVDSGVLCGKKVEQDGFYLVYGRKAYLLN